METVATATANVWTESQQWMGKIVTTPKDEQTNEQCLAESEWSHTLRLHLL